MPARKGKGTKLRFGVLAAGATARPAEGDFIALTGMQSSEISRGQELDDTPDGDYETTDSNMWRDGDTVRQLTWSLPISGHITDSAAQATALETLLAQWALGRPVWIERLKAGKTDWEGGRALVLDPTDPADWNAEQAFSCSFQGQGAIVETPVVA